MRSNINRRRVDFSPREICTREIICTRGLKSPLQNVRRSPGTGDAQMRGAIRALTLAARRSFAFAVALLAGGLSVQADEWNYVVPATNDEAASVVYPVAQALFLSTTKPEDLHEDGAPYRGKLRRYAQLRYGSPSSIRVACVIDELEDGTAELYIDANRNRTIEKRDKVAGAAPDWVIPLDVAIPHDNEVDLYRRRLSIHRGATGRTLAVATLGYMEGTITIGGRTVAARRVDGDANGSFADAADRLWVDWNADGVWDPFTEQFAFAAILRFGGERFAARSDTLGHRLTLEPLAGSGKVRLVLSAKLMGENVAGAEGVTVAATLVGRDGSAVLVSGLGQPAEIPSGEYQLQVVVVSLSGKDDSRRWNFEFSSTAGRQRPWREVKTGATLDLDPIGSLELAIDLESNKIDCRPGDTVTVLPRLYTGDGLLINACYWGTGSADEKNHSKCTVALSGLGGPVDSALASCQSGFL